MKRLIANEQVNDLLDKNIKQLDNICKDYYIFLEQLNTLYNTFPDAYTEIEQTVKLPTKQEVEQLVEMKKDMQSISDKFKNDNYAEEYIEEEE